MTLYTDGKEVYSYDGNALSNSKGELITINNRVVREAQSLLGIKLKYVGRI